jgi:hypothetical protein
MLMNTDEGGASAQSEGWGDWLRDAAASVEEQPDVDSEEVEESEDPVENTEESETEGDDQEVTEEAEPVVDEDPDIDIGEGRQPVKMSELKAGYLRQSDYTKKTQELSTQRKEFEALQEQIKPAQEWLSAMDSNPWLFQQINAAIQQFNQTNTLPLEELLDGSEYGVYINHLMAENNRLTKELETTKGEYEGVKLTADMTRLSQELKGKYGDLVTDDYMQQLQERGKTEKLSASILKEIANGHLATQAMEQSKTTSKKTEAKAIQKLQETIKSAPVTPKAPSGQPAKEEVDYGSMNWLDALKFAAKGK